MSTITTTTPTTDRPATRASKTTRRIARLSVAAPAALATAVLLHPHDTEDAHATLERIAGEDRGRWVLAHLLEPAAWIGLALVLLLVARLGRQHGRRLVQAGATMAAIGATAIASLVYSHGEAYLFMTEPGMDRTAMERLYSHSHDAMPLAGPLALLFQLGLILLGVGLLRSRLVPRWAGALLAVTPIVMLASGGAPPAIGAVVLGVPMVAGFAGCAKAIGTANA